MQRIVFANSFDSVRHFWVTHQSALISRPTLHTFHTVVSDSSNFTIGTSPWDESCKRRRKAAATALNVVSVRGYMPIVDLEATTSIKEMIKDYSTPPQKVMSRDLTAKINTQVSFLSTTGNKHGKRHQVLQAQDRKATGHAH